MEASLRAAAVSALIALAVVLSATTAGTAAAASVTTRQLAPGVTTRTIWDTAKIACYRLPDRVDHAGPIHVELAFTPVSADMDLYLLDAQGRRLGGVDGEQGTLGSLFGRETVDFVVDEVGFGTYYVLAVAFTDTAKVRLTGYFPLMLPGADGTRDRAADYRLKSFGFPRDPAAWLTLKGPSSGTPYVSRPTSVGQGSCRLEWPAAAASRTITYDPTGAPQPASMGQYLYAGPSWVPVVANAGGWAPPAQDGWWGLFDAYTVAPGGPARPQVDVHYVPNLYAVASDPLLGVAAPPATGLLTRGFRAILTYPENLRISGVTRSGDDRLVRGTFALGGSYASGASVTLQRQTRTGWVNVRTVFTDPAGVWTAPIRVTEPIKVRAKAAGEPSSGLKVEYSVIRTIGG